MRRRLQHTYVTLLAAVLLGLDIPLAITLASRDTQEMVIDRQSDAIRFAALADPALRSGRTTDALRAELDALGITGPAEAGHYVRQASQPVRSVRL